MLRFLIGTIIIICLAGCAGKSDTRQAGLKPYRPYDVPKDVEACTPQCVTPLGAIVQRVGNQVKVVLPSSYMFFDNSAHFKPYGNLLMKQAINYMNHFDKSTIKVAAYTDHQFGTEPTKALSTHRARKIVSFLRENDLRANFVYSKGKGGEKPVAFHDVSDDRLMNQRIEMTFRYQGYLYEQ